MIVGRDGPLAALGQALDAAEAGRRTSVLVLGDPGMGTTTLLDSAARDARSRGHMVVRAVASEAGHEIPYALATDVVSRLAGSVRTAATSTQGRPPQAPDLDSVPGTAEIMRDTLAQAARRGPLLLCLDDLAWADDESLSVVSLAVGRLTDARVAVVASACPGFAHDRRFATWDRVDVGPLTLDEAVLLLEVTLATSVPRAQAERLAHALARCPAAIVECRRLLAAEQIEGTRPLPDPLRLDAHLQSLWQREVDHLPAPAARALLALSVLTSSDTLLVTELLRAVGSHPDDLAPAVAAGLVVPATATAPPQVKTLVRAAVLSTAPPRTLRDLHARAAAVAERLGAAPAVLVRHLWLAAEPGDAAIIEKLDQQARRAHERDQPDVAARAWEAAARLTVEPTRRAHRGVMAARTWLTESSAPVGGQSLLRLLSESDLDERDTVYREWLRAEVVAGHDLDAASAAALAAAEHARRAEPSLVPWLLWTAATTGWASGRVDLALHAAQAAKAWLDEPGHPRSPGLPAWLGPALLGTALLEAGETSRGVPLRDQARAAAQSWTASPGTSLSELINVVALDELLLVDGRAADVRLAELASRLAGHGAAALGATEAIHAWRAFRRGDWTTARAVGADALLLARAAHASAEETSALTLLVEIDAKAGAPESDDHVDQLLRLARAVGDARAIACAARARGVAWLACGEIEEATVALEPLADTSFLGRGVHDAPLAGRVDLVEAYVHAGRRHDARDLVHRVAVTLDALGDADATAAVLRCRALVTPDDAIELFRAALDAHADGRDRFEASRTRLLLGQRLRRAHRISEARHELERACDDFEALGAWPWHSMAAAEVRAGRRRSSTRSRTTSTGDPKAALSMLTSQETRVAQAVASGATNREVAADLVLSVRTVEFHLSNVLRKLDLPNRAALAHLLTVDDA